MKAVNRRAVLGPLLLLALLTSVAQAQIGLADISITVDDEGPTLDVDGSAVVDFTVTNEASMGPDLEVAVAIVELPSGWGATLDTGAFTLAAGESRQVSLTLRPTSKASLGTASITLEARGTYGIPPIEQPLDEAVATATVTAKLRTAPSDATDWVPVWLLPVLIVAAATAVGFAFWAAHRSIRLLPAATRLDAAAGTLAVLPVQVRNATGKVQRIQLSLECGDDAWRPDITPSALQLPPGQEREVELQVIVPEETGAVCRVTVRAESDSGRRSRTRIHFGAT